MASTTRPGAMASRAEAKSDTTTKIARAIIAAEDTARRAKTEKLRLARLAKEAEEEAVGATEGTKRQARKR